MNNTVNLNECVSGQKLLTKHGTILTYIERLPEDHYYDHKIQYPGGGYGTRTNDGFVYRTPVSRLPTDEDIIEILPLNP